VLTAAEAQETILAAIQELPTEAAFLEEANERILRQIVNAERDQPPFDRVMMDGITFSFADLVDRGREFPVQATQAAGDAALELQAGYCIEIMTGASLPGNADCIVPVERVTIRDGVAVIAEDYDAKPARFIHPRASDHAAGARLLTPGKRISPMDIAIIASCGLTQVAVSRNPVIRVISTGNELVPPGSAIEPHQIRLSNGPAIQAMLRERGYTDCNHEHLADDVDVLRTRIAAHLAAANVLILSGGVSMGKADFVPDVLTELGVTARFHKISQRPGKPMWFGLGPDNKAVFALPGNPVSALVCCRQYVIPALEKASAATPKAPEFAALASDVTFKPDLTCFQPVHLVSNAAGQVLAMPVPTNTSGDFTALSASDGYVELPREQGHFPAGTPVFLHRWRRS